MIYKLSGKLIVKEPTHMVIDVNGVCYEVSISLSTYTKSVTVGENCEIFTYMVAKEDGISLYGFMSLSEKQLFLQLISVSGIGPKVALKMLGGIPPDDLRAAIVSANYALLSTVPGVGKKSAERLVVELRDKFNDVVLSEAIVSGDNRQDVVGALVNLGYKLDDCRKAVLMCKATDDFETVLKTALNGLAGNR